MIDKDADSPANGGSGGGMTQVNSLLRIFSDLSHARISLRCIDAMVSSSARVGVRVRLDEIGVVVETGRRIATAIRGLKVVKVMPEDLERVVDVVPAEQIQGEGVVIFAQVTDLTAKAEGLSLQVCRLICLFVSEFVSLFSCMYVCLSVCLSVSVCP